MCCCLLFFGRAKVTKNLLNFLNEEIFILKKNELEKQNIFFSEAIKKNPDFADAYNNRGVVYLKVGRTDEALKDFEKAVSVDDSFVDAKAQFRPIVQRNWKDYRSGDTF